MVRRVSSSLEASIHPAAPPPPATSAADAPIPALRKVRRLIFPGSSSGGVLLGVLGGTTRRVGRGFAKNGGSEGRASSPRAKKEGETRLAQGLVIALRHSRGPSPNMRLRLRISGGGESGTCFEGAHLLEVFAGGATDLYRKELHSGLPVRRDRPAAGSRRLGRCRGCAPCERSVLGGQARRRLVHPYIVQTGRRAGVERAPRAGGARRVLNGRDVACSRPRHRPSPW